MNNIKSYCPSCDTRYEKSAVMVGVCPVCRGNVRDVQTGVYQKYNQQVDIEFIIDADHRGINLSYEEALNNHSCEDYGCTEDSWHDEFTESYEPNDETYLIGSWKGSIGEYEPDETGEYAALSRADVIQVVWSTHVRGYRSMCSPCYPNQIDCDSGNGELLAYSLPEDAFEGGK